MAVAMDDLCVAAQNIVHLERRALKLHRVYEGRSPRSHNRNATQLNNVVARGTIPRSRIMGPRRKRRARMTTTCQKPQRCVTRFENRLGGLGSPDVPISRNLPVLLQVDGWDEGLGPFSSSVYSDTSEVQAPISAAIRALRKNGYDGADVLQRTSSKLMLQSDVLVLDDNAKAMARASSRKHMVPTTASLCAISGSTVFACIYLRTRAPTYLFLLQSRGAPQISSNWPEPRTSQFRARSQSYRGSTLSVRPAKVFSLRVTRHWRKRKLRVGTCFQNVYGKSATGRLNRFP